MKTRLRLLAAMLLFVFVASYAEKPIVSVLGDSYSTYEGLVWPKNNHIWYKAEPNKGNDVTKPEQTWWKILTAEDSPYTLGVNNSYSGATICFTGYHKHDYSDRSFITRMYGLGTPDIILIFGGTNDAWAKVPVGEYQNKNFSRADLFNYRPALSYLLQNMRTIYPGTDIYFILNSDLEGDVPESSKVICKKYRVPVIELHDIDKIAGHPSQAGMKAVASQVREALDPIYVK